MRVNSQSLRLLRYHAHMEKQKPFVVPTEQQLREAFETWQRGGKEGLVRLLTERQRQAELAATSNDKMMPDEHPDK